MKKNIVIIVMSIVVLCMGVYLYIDSKNSIPSTDIEDKNNALLGDNTNIKDNSKVDEKQESQNNIVEDEKQDSPNIVVAENKQETSKENTNVDKKENIISEEVTTDPISYFQYEVKVLDNAKENDITLKDRAKQTFINIVDFIFYDKEIKGYRFSELTNDAKLKIIEIALTIDNKIDTKFPKYKDTIKSNVDNIKGKLAVKYLEVSSKICDSMGEDNCNLAKESFNNLKKSFSFTFDLVKELAKSGSQKVKEIYEKFRD